MKKILTSIIFIIFCSIFQVNSQICVNYGATTTICNGQNRIFRAYFIGCTNPQSVFWAQGPTTNGPWTIIGNGSSITVTPGASVAYSCALTNSTSNSNFGPNAVWFTVDNPLTQPSISVIGQTTFCVGSNVSLTLPNLGSSTTYQWKLNNSNIGANSNTHLANLSGNYTAVVSNACGSVVSSNAILVTVNPLPLAAGTITGTATVCQGQNSVTYTVPTITNATSYITVKGNNSCGDGATSTLAITVNPIPATPAITLSGNTLLSDAQAGNQWYDQSGSINGAINQSYSAIVDGDYFTIVTLLGCSSDTSNIINVFLTDIEDLPLHNEIKIYPNPVLDELTIEIEGNNQKQNFEILNANGQVVFRGEINEKTTVQTSKFTSGVFFIKLANSKTYEFKKIIKE